MLERPVLGDGRGAVPGGRGSASLDVAPTVLVSVQAVWTNRSGSHAGGRRADRGGDRGGLVVLTNVRTAKAERNEAWRLADGSSVAESCRPVSAIPIPIIPVAALQRPIQ